MLTTSPQSPPGEPAAPGILKKFAYLVTARWFRDACQTGFFIYLARQSSTTYGEFMLALGMGSILMLVSEFGLNLPLVTLLARPDRDPGESLSQVSFLKSAFLLLALSGVVVFVRWQGYAPPLQRLVLLLSLGVGLEALANTFFVALQVKGRQDLQGKVKALGTAVGFSYGAVTLLAGAGPLVVAGFKLLEALVNIGGAVWLVLGPGVIRLQWPSPGRLWNVIRLGMLFGVIEVAATTYNKANLFFLQRYAGADGVAQYSVTWQMVDGVSALVSSLLLQSVLYPVLVQLWERNRDRVPGLAQNTARWLMIAALPVMFMLFIESDRLIPLVFGPRYPEAIWMQKLLVVTVAFAFLHNLAAFLIISMGLARLLLIFYLGGLVFNLLWCSLAIPRIPLLGGALAMVLTKGAVALCTVSYCQRRIGLFTWRTLKQLGLAVLAGAGLYFFGRQYLGREAGEVLALAPILLLAWRWWRAERARQAGSREQV